VQKGEAKAAVQSHLHPFDLPIRLTRVRALVVAVLDKQAARPARR